LVLTGIFVIFLLGLLVVFIGGYFWGWTWTGFGSYADVDGKLKPAKTLWDWMQLLIVPSVLAGGALAFNVMNSRTQENITDDNQRETALQAYFDKMSELLLHKGLRTSRKNAEVRSVARTRTVSVLRALDKERKSLLIQFLQESQLINTTNTIINLWDADLSDIDLNEVILSHVDLSFVNLSGANLVSADLQGAVLRETDLTNANLKGADLTGANLNKAKVTLKQLAMAKSLKGATMPDGTKHK